MTLMGALREQLNDEKQQTENGAIGYRTSGRHLLDLNFAVGSMRNWGDERILREYKKAYYEQPLLAVKWLFYLRDIRGIGMGERHIFQICMHWLMEDHFEEVSGIIGLIPEYGRFDDWLALLDTKAKDIIISKIMYQLEQDLQAMIEERPASLLAKWLPSCNTSSASTRKLGKIVCQSLGFTERTYRKILASLRAYIDVVEVKMSSESWGDIDYSKVPSRANLIYGSAFLHRDEVRRRAFLDKLTRGEAKINADTLFPSDIVAKYYQQSRFAWGYGKLAEKDETLEGLWKALPDYVKGDAFTLVVRDGSGSMQVNVGNTKVTALNVSTALAIYFAEHARGEFHNQFITFSSRPEMIDLSEAKSLRDKIDICETYRDCTNTNLQDVFELILYTAVDHHLSQEELPDNILIISDMEFDRAIYKPSGEYGKASNVYTQSLMAVIQNKYAFYGYEMPRLVFWNVCSRTNTIPIQQSRAGVALVSGFNPAVYNMVLSNETDPYQCLLKQINDKRYEAVEKALE